MKAARAADYLGHVIEAINRIETYTAGLDREAFMAARMVQDAVVRNFEILGEAASNMERHAPELTAAHPEIPWRFVRGMRNHLANGYAQVDYDRVWFTSCDNLPILRAQIEGLKRDLENGAP